MARINVRASVSAPEEINIPLVRADVAANCNIFRTFFEVFLALFSTIFGYALSLPKWDTMQRFILIVLGGAAAIFLGMSLWFGRKGKVENTSE